MRLAVLSDIHGNLTAFEAVLADLESVGSVDKIWVLGDLAALGPRPVECIRKVKAMQEAAEKGTFGVISGNTDRYLVTGERMPTPPAKDEEAFAKLATAWSIRDRQFNWGMAQLGFEDYEYLKKLRHELSVKVARYGPVIGYHAVPGDDEAMLLPDTPEEQALDYLLDREGVLAIGGHIHRQMNRDLGAWRVVNVGSVGMSFDMPGKAQWGLFTFLEDSLMVDLRAVPYDVDAVIADLHAVGFPDPDAAAARYQ
ncbi:MAG: metallophosphoesterase [Chloroflexi bacterium]|nr:MAG: hypothetical protein CUN54_01880 [Phototrophicales bacterium]RMF82855.1 MAG: metallophosphoesterase [Chloroflexota bacterium]